MLIQEELFALDDFTDKDIESINQKDYVFLKRNFSEDKIIPINLYKKQGYVTKIQVIDGKRLCTVFFGRTMEYLYDYQLTKRNV